MKTLQYPTPELPEGGLEDRDTSYVEIMFNV